MSFDLISVLQSGASEAVIDAFTQQLGAGTKRNQTSKAVEGGVSILMNALARNARQQQGRASLEAALEKDHDGSILDDVAGFINGSSSFNNSRAANGAGILKHVLGGKQSGAIDALAQMSGLNKGQSADMLVKLAPIVLGMLGRQKRSAPAAGAGGIDLSSILGQAAGNMTKKTGQASLIESLLDQDGDGSIQDEVANVGINLLKGLFKRRR